MAKLQIKLCVMLVACLVGLVATKRCTVKDDLKYQYSQCDPLTKKANVHFYYDEEDRCEPERVQDFESGEIITEGSDPIPPYLPIVDCNKLCGVDGHYQFIQFYPQMQQVCSMCPANSIAIDGGFIIDAKMDDEDFIGEKMALHMTVDCFKLHFNQPSSNTQEA